MIYYLGPQGSFTHEAALKIFNKKNLIPSKSIEDALDNVKDGKQNIFSIVPVENSLHGLVIRTLDLILEKNLQVISEINIPIKQNLLSKETTLKNITTIYSHPHAIAQTRHWIKKYLKSAEIVETPSTSHAAHLASELSMSAAIGSTEAAKFYKLNNLSKNINDFSRNITRFWLVSKKNSRHQPQIVRSKLPTKSTIYIVIKDKVGALHKLLDTFAQNFISLTSIQSRPLPNQPWKYGFFCDLLVDADDPLAKKMMNRLKQENPDVSLLGTYPQIGLYNYKETFKYNLKRIENIFKANRFVVKKLNFKKPNYLPRIKKIFDVRTLMTPSVALYKFKSNQPLFDPKRESDILHKIKKSDTLYGLYKKIFKDSKFMQADIVSLLRQKKIKQTDIVSFSLTELRYYIDYLDALAEIV